MNKQEKELLESYRKLRPESRKLIMSMVVAAVTSESVTNLQHFLPIRQQVSDKGGINEMHITK